MTGKKGRRGNRQGGVRYRRGAWWMRYTDQHGEQVEERTDARSKTDAADRLRAKLGEVRARVDPSAATVAVLYERLIENNTAVGKGTRNPAKHWKHLDPHFGTLPAAGGVTTPRLMAYRADREQRVKASTVNRELATLRRMLHLGRRATPPLVQTVPHFPMADERPFVRQGYFTPEEWAKVESELADHLRPLMAAAYWLGWRAGELRSLTWSRLDLKAGTVELATGQTKNRDSRLIYLPPALHQILREQRAATTALERNLGRLIPHVFHNGGRAIVDYSEGWHGALKRAGLEGRIVHDFRRTAARNYRRSGTAEEVAMKITGHKTASIFRRYNITDEEDMRSAATRIGRALAAPLRSGKAVATGRTGRVKKPGNQGE